MAKETGDAEELAAFIVGASLIFFAAFVAMKLWGWFMVPLGVVAVGYWHAAGLMVTVGYLGKNVAPKDPARSDLDRALAGWLTSGVALGLGFLFSLGVAR